MGESKKRSSSVRRIYLATYNLVLCGGWSQILAHTLYALVVGTPVYPGISNPLYIWQTLALFEIFNIIVGVVRSPLAATVLQISSRLFITWGILYSFPETSESWLLTSLILSWSVTEVIRYLFFCLKEAFGHTPDALLWLRYSTFFVLYPTGILSEVGLIYLALPYIKGSALYSLRMPNRLNFAFDFYYASVMVLCFYIPGAPYMYTYMIGQRKKALGRVSKQKPQ